MDCRLSKKATRKQTNIEKNLMENARSLLSPNTNQDDLSLLPLVIKTAMRELSMIAVDANRVDAIMLFLSVCTAKTPFLDTSCTIKKLHD